MTRAELLSALQVVEDDTRRILSSSDDGTAQFIADGQQLKALNTRGAELLAALKALDAATAPIEEAMAATEPGGGLLMKSRRAISHCLGGDEVAERLLFNDSLFDMTRAELVKALVCPLQSRWKMDLVSAQIVRLDSMVAPVVVAMTMTSCAEQVSLDFNALQDVITVNEARRSQELLPLAEGGDVTLSELSSKSKASH